MPGITLDNLKFTVAEKNKLKERLIDGFADKIINVITDKQVKQIINGIINNIVFDDGNFKIDDKLINKYLDKNVKMLIDDGIFDNQIQDSIEDIIRNKIQMEKYFIAAAIKALNKNKKKNKIKDSNVIIALKK